MPAPVAQASAAFGERIRALGDVDGDGARDLLVSTPNYDGVNPTGGTPINNSGRAYIFSGRTRALLRTIEPPGTVEANEKFGFWSANLGDVDGDGAADFVTSASSKVVPPATGATGQVYVFSGKTGALLRTINAPEPLMPAAMGFGGDFGGNVIAPGDLTGDGITDLVATSSGAFNGAGAAYAFDGKTGVFLYKVGNPDAGQLSAFGFGASEVGDVNGDGRADYLIGAPLYDAGTAAAGMDVGRAYVINGRTGAVLFTLDNPPVEAEAGDRFGAPDADGISLGDVTGDGRPDIYVNSVSGNEPQPAGAPLDNAGKVFTFSGATGNLIRAVHDPVPAASRSFGVSHASAGDLDQDGRPDSLVGVRPGGNPAGIGRVTVFSGASLGTAGTSPATVLKVFPDPGDQQPGALFGAGIASPGDVNADGLPDYFVAARSYDTGGVINVGIVWAYTSIAPPASPTPTSTPTPTPTPTPVPPASIQLPTPKPPTPTRRKGKLSASVTKTDLRAPFRFTTSGRLTLPGGLAKAVGCKGRVSVQVKRASTTISTRRVSLRKDCTYSVRVTFANARRFAQVKKLKFTARFLGNTRVSPAAATPRFGRVRR